MPGRILQINFKFSMSREELDALVSGRAEAIAAVAGLQWKIWLINDEKHESGGLYLFTDEDSLDNYVNGPLIEGLKNHPAINDITVKKFASLDAATTITRGPV